MLAIKKEKKKKEREYRFLFARIDKAERRESTSLFVPFRCKMCPHLFRYCTIVFNLLFLSRLITVGAWPFATVVSFGDSLTDSGNVYRLTNHSWPLVPPYYHGRFTDGPVWIEELGALDVNNYAHGGATSDNGFVQGYTASGTVAVAGARQQIQRYLNTTPQHKRESPWILHIIWIGSNDYYFNGALSPSQVASSVLNAAQDLLDHRVKNLLVFNQLPRYVRPSVLTNQEVNHYREQTMQHNTHLSLGLSKLKYHRHESSVRLFDIYSLVLDIIANTSTGFSNQKTSCWNITDGRVLAQCPNPESYLFIDQYHFTTRMHQFIAEGVRQFFHAHSSANIRSTHCISLLVFVLFFSQT